MSLDNGSSAVGMPELVVIRAAFVLEAVVLEKSDDLSSLDHPIPDPFYCQYYLYFSKLVRCVRVSCDGRPSWMLSARRVFVRFAAAPNHGRSLSRRWRRRCNLPCFHDNDLVLRFDGVRPARSTFESSATATRFQRGFHVSCNRFQRGLPVRCRIFQRVSKVRAHRLAAGCRPLS